MNGDNRFSWSGPAWNDPSLLNNSDNDGSETTTPVNQPMDPSSMNLGDFYNENIYDSRFNTGDQNLNRDESRNTRTRGSDDDKRRSTRGRDRDGDRRRSTRDRGRGGDGRRTNRDRDRGRSRTRNGRDRDIIADIIDRLL